MTYSSFFCLCSSCIGFLGAIFFSIGILRQSKAEMAERCVSFWDWSEGLAHAYAAQKAEYLFGGGLISVSFFLQFSSFLVPCKIFFPTEWAGYIIWGAIPVTGILFLIFRRCCSKIGNHFEQQIKKMLKKDSTVSE